MSYVGAPSGDGFVIGHVVSAEKHPNADRLKVCVVDTGDGERTIVCGASNVDGGQTVAVAVPGALIALEAPTGLDVALGPRLEHRSATRTGAAVHHLFAACVSTNPSRH